MKAFHLKDVELIHKPYGYATQSMVNTTTERVVTFQDGTRGFILGDKVLAPFHLNKSCVVTRQEKNLVLTFESTNEWAISTFKLPFSIPVEPLTFRHEVLHADSFMFRVFDEVIMCSGFAVKDEGGRLEINHPNQFCPVFDRFGHLIGINNGKFNEKLLCIPIKKLL